MKKLHYLLTLLALLASAAVFAQPRHARWSATTEHLDGDRYKIVFVADIDHGWHLYDLGPYIDGPNETRFSFDNIEGLRLEGSVKEKNKPVRKYDELFGMEIGYYDIRAVFEQTVRLTAPVGTMSATVEWMVCDDQNCMPPTDDEFKIEIRGNANTAISGAGIGQGIDTVTGDPEEESEDTVIADDGVVPTESEEGEVPGSSTGGEPMGGMIIAAILAGFAALLTPCVFPMVPMTVSFFIKKDGSSAAGRFHAFMYGFFIVALYTIPIGIIIFLTWLISGDVVTADIFNWIATHWLPNIIFFVVFMVFAASFFGAFEITLPSKLVNRSDSNVDRKGLLGIFFMALTLVLVSFSCTGPIVAFVLAQSTSGAIWEPIVTMFAFSVAFALPFTLCAFFPSLLGKMPKSGGWLNSVKVVLSFIEVALGLKFLSVADQTYHWGILPRELYLAIWIVVFTLLGFYLLGKIKFAHDSDLKYVGVGRLGLTIVVFTFVVYLIPGMFGAPLKAISGYLPPITADSYVAGRPSDTAPDNMLLTVDGRKPKYSDFLHLPHGLQGFFDLDEAKDYSRAHDKPVFIDFTGHGCVNCREMEAKVWSDPRVLSLLRDRYVVVGLYVDDKKVLPESQWVTTDAGKVLKSMGRINSHYAFTTYGMLAQPYYVIQDTDNNILVPPRGYNLDVDAFVAFLEEGLEAYRSR